MAATLLVLGGGKMGSALLSGMFASESLDPSDVVVVEPGVQRREELSEAFRGITVVDTPEIDHIDEHTGVLLCVKPDIAESVCRLVGGLGAQRILSVVAGIACARLEATLPGPVSVVRAMPNTPALVGAGMTVISGGSHVTKDDLDWAEELLSQVGTVLRLPERHLDAVTGLSGSGPAYVFLIAEALIEAGVAAGLNRDVARTLAAHTIYGAGKMLVETGDSPESLRAAVTSPGGTTAAGLRALESRAVRSAIFEAVMASIERSKNVGR